MAELVGRYAPELEVIHYNAAVIRSQTLQEQSLASIAEDIVVCAAEEVLHVRSFEDARINPSSNRVHDMSAIFELG